eukprot:TRINITY_DN2546_c0_g1_i1.p1 TRINITY_DN2546_c0_g1~~TRINITY_DN2546_c0_g1_i1.p1  ORF type:complete len:351 (-),score=28.86 TRINITY_DN2546_c0_g1_i1:88-1140(-)
MANPFIGKTFVVIDEQENSKCELANESISMPANFPGQKPSFGACIRISDCRLKWTGDKRDRTVSVTNCQFELIQAGQIHAVKSVRVLLICDGEFLMLQNRNSDFFKQMKYRVNDSAAWDRLADRAPIVTPDEARFLSTGAQNGTMFMPKEVRKSISAKILSKPLWPVKEGPCADWELPGGSLNHGDPRTQRIFPDTEQAREELREEAGIHIDVAKAVKAGTCVGGSIRHHDAQDFTVNTKLFVCAVARKPKVSVEGAKEFIDYSWKALNAPNLQCISCLALNETQADRVLRAADAVTQALHGHGLRPVRQRVRPVRWAVQLAAAAQAPASDNAGSAGVEVLNEQIADIRL